MLTPYNQVALKRFIDGIVTEIMEVQLILSLSDILSPITVFSMPNDKITEIAGESEENCSLREQISKKLHILTRGLETCKRFASARTLGR